eukprot:5588491-Pyramimonas_sp.AAC.1
MPRQSARERLQPAGVGAIARCKCARSKDARARVHPGAPAACPQLLARSTRPRLAKDGAARSFRAPATFPASSKFDCCHGCQGGRVFPRGLG